MLQFVYITLVLMAVGATYTAVVRRRATVAMALSAMVLWAGAIFGSFSVQTTNGSGSVVTVTHPTMAAIGFLAVLSLLAFTYKALKDELPEPDYKKAMDEMPEV